MVHDCPCCFYILRINPVFILKIICRVYKELNSFDINFFAATAIRYVFCIGVREWLSNFKIFQIFFIFLSLILVWKLSCFPRSNLKFYRSYASNKSCLYVYVQFTRLQTEILSIVNNRLMSCIYNLRIQMQKLLKMMIPK